MRGLRLLWITGNLWAVYVWNINWNFAYYFRFQTLKCICSAYYNRDCHFLISCNMEFTNEFNPNFTTTYVPNTSDIVPSCREFDPVPIGPHVLALLSSVSSIIGAVVIVITYVALSEIRNVPRAMLVCLTVADFLTATGNIIGSVRYMYLQSSEESCNKLKISDTTCVVQSYITTMSSMASFFWTVAIAVHMFAQLVKRGPGVRQYRQLWLYNVICWGIPGTY